MFSGIICYGGMDGRRNDQGNPSPNSDLYLFKLRLGGGYEWSLIDLDPASLVPPGRTLHSACSISEDELFVFGGVHSATPYQCLADGKNANISTFWHSSENRITKHYINNADKMFANY